DSGLGDRGRGVVLGNEGDGVGLGLLRRALAIDLGGLAAADRGAFAAADLAAANRAATDLATLTAANRAAERAGRGAGGRPGPALDGRRGVGADLVDVAHRVPHPVPLAPVVRRVGVGVEGEVGLVVAVDPGLGPVLVDLALVEVAVVELEGVLGQKG